MDLVAQLANPGPRLESLLNLPLPEEPIVSPAPPKPAVPQLRVGAVRDAMVAVLLEADEPLRTAEIYERVVQRLGVPVTYGNVKDFLGARSHPPKQLFVHVGWGRYQLHEDVTVDGLWPRVGGRRSRRRSERDSGSRNDSVETREPAS